MLLACLHNVIGAEPDEFDRKCSRISSAEFEAFVERTAKRYDLVSFSEFLRGLEEKRFAPRVAALTFDDGFRGVLQYAFPILKRRGLDAGAFVNPPCLIKEPLFHFLEIELAFRLTERSSARLDFLPEELDFSTVKARVKAMKQVKRRLKTIPEADRDKYHAQLMETLGVTRDQMAAHARKDERYATMNKDEVLSLRKAGWPIGSHTLTHRSVGMLPAEEARKEISGSKKMLDDLLGGAEPIFAYPYGEAVHIGETAGLCKEAGYRYAFTTIPGDITSVERPHLLSRVDYKEFLTDFL